jgi:hypothetical protein
MRGVGVSARRHRQAPSIVKLSRAAAERTLVAGGFVVLFFALPHALEGDDAVRFDDLHQLLHGHLTASKFSLLMPIVSTPVVLLGHVVESGPWWAARFNVLVVALGTLVVRFVLRDRADARLFRLVLLALLFASLLTNRLRAYDAEVLTATLITIGIVCNATRRYVGAGWAAIALGAANTPVLVVALVPFAAYEAVKAKRLRPFAWLALAALLVMAEAWIRRGSPFDTGYAGDRGYRTILPYSGRPDFSYPFLLGVASLLFSFGRGLLFFTPGLALWLLPRIREAAAGLRLLIVPMLLIVAGMVLVYAKWWAWYGGLSWGPRFFPFAAVPASLLVGVGIRRAGASIVADLAVLCVLAVSVWVGVVGATADYSANLFCAHNGYALESLCWYVPEYSSLWWPVLHPPAVTLGVAIVTAWCAAVFVYLALPLVRAVAAKVHRPAELSDFAHGWRL